jgi:sialic acid synthase SpsE
VTHGRSRKCFVRIKEHCDERGILFLATPFGEAKLRALVELGVPALKFASTDLTNAPLLAAGAATGLPMLLSTGASTEEEITDAVERLRRAGTMDRLLLLHCVSCYPTPPGAINLRAIRSLEQRFRVPCGLSDHTTSPTMGAMAVAAGACVLEKHFTLDRNAVGPDHAMSLDPSQWKEYVAAVRAMEAALGDGRIGLTGLEREVRLVAGKSVVAAQDIPVGTRLGGEMLTVKRPGSGVAPAELPALLNRRAAIDIVGDTVLTWDMVE